MWLLDDVLAAAGDWRPKLRVLDEAALLVDVGTYGALPDCPDLAAIYGRLGQQLCREGDATPLRTLSAALLATPSWNVRIDPFPQELVHCELLALAQQERWAEASQCCRRLRYFLRLGDPSYYTPPWKEQAEATLHVLRWAEAQAWLTAPQLPAGLPHGKGTLSRRQWRHPLTERVNKEGFSQLAEFDAAVASGEYRGACQVAVSWSNAAAGGLLPAAKDQRLLQSLSAIMESAMQQVPALRQTMREQFAPMGQLRLKQAIADGDTAAVAAVTLQFYGTEAAADAHLWLGDRWLSRGEAARAIGHYRELLPDAPAEQRDGVAARMRLAGAMLGRNVGVPAHGGGRVWAGPFHGRGVRAAGGTGPPARHEDGSDAAIAASTATAGNALPAPGQYGARPWARLDAPKDVLAVGRTGCVCRRMRRPADRGRTCRAGGVRSGQRPAEVDPSSAVEAEEVAVPIAARGRAGRPALCAARQRVRIGTRVSRCGRRARRVDRCAGRQRRRSFPNLLLAGRNVLAVCSAPKPDGTLRSGIGFLRFASRAACKTAWPCWS